MKKKNKPKKPPKDYTIHYDPKLLEQIGKYKYYSKTDYLPPPKEKVIILDPNNKELEAVRIGLLYYKSIDDIENINLDADYYNFYSEYWRFT